MKKDEMVCDCDVIHEDVADAVRKNFPTKGSFTICRISLRSWATARG